MQICVPVSYSRMNTDSSTKSRTAHDGGGSRSSAATYLELCRICTSAFLTGPITWPLAAVLLARQQGNRSFSFSRLFSEHGGRRAFAGCGPYSFYKLLGISIQRGVQVPALADLMVRYPTMPSVLKYALAGLLSGIIGGLVVTPIEQLRISRANGDFASFKNMIHFFSSRDASGLAPLMAGARITVYRNVVFDAVNSVLYNTSINSGSIDLMNPLQVGMVNAVVGVLTAVIDYPLDVLKSHIQSAAVRRRSMYGAANSSNSHNPPATPLALARHIVRTKGVSALYGGIQQKLVLYFAVWGVYGSIFSVVGNLFMIVTQ